MAYYELQPLATTSAKFLIDLATFASSNGWTIDFNGVYQTTEYRIHMHKGLLHIDSYSSGATSYFYHCTGYVFGSHPSAQPGTGAGGGGSIPITVNQPYAFYSTVGGIYFEVWSSGIAKVWSAMFHLQTKIGAFADGFGAVWNTNNMCQDGMLNSNIYVNGLWGGTSSSAGSLAIHPPYPGVGALGPNVYNAGISPFPILVTMKGTDTTRRVPLGFLPGCYSTNATSIYANGSLIIIGTDTYKLASVGGNLSSTEYSGLFLFKLGA